jgi:hypothetical protein
LDKSSASGGINNIQFEGFNPVNIIGLFLFFFSTFLFAFFFFCSADFSLRHAPDIKKAADLLMVVICLMRGVRAECAWPKHRRTSARSGKKKIANATPTSCSPQLKTDPAAAHPP